MKTEMLSISGMRWYMATALDCSSVVVDTMSWRGMVTHKRKEKRWMMTYYREVIHRLDGPAMEYADGSKSWYVNGQLHRLYGPPVEYADGTKRWFVSGQLHRFDGPASEIANM